MKISLPKLNYSFFLITIVFFVSYQNPVYGKPFPASVIAAKELAKRIMPRYYTRFVFEQINSSKDVFELESVHNKIVIRGNNANSMAVGLNYYLKYDCNADVSWYKEDALCLPEKLPQLKGKFTEMARCKTRFFLNYCTFGYTMAWWDWSQWQWFIDWMALNGVNMPLAITGQEAIWQHIWKKSGLTDKEIDNYFTGPAYLPWHRMANIDGWDGPLPKSWIDAQVKLGKKIVNRERELGMTPVLPAFAGHVPKALKRIYPSAKITSLGNWGNFEPPYNSYFLDSFDPLFNKIQKEFVTEQTKLFGTNHVYGVDPFNEVTPPSWDSRYLADASSNIYRSLALADRKSQWLQMTWMFFYQRDKWTDPRIKSFLTAVPLNKMILLDYFCDKTEIWKMTNKFYGQPYIWCYLGNFGGNTCLTGDLEEVEKRMENAFENGGANLQGIGSTLEGLDCNALMYEFVFEKAWSNGPTDLKKWLAGWSARRLGKPDENVAAAWNMMLKNIYTHNNSALNETPSINAVPTFKNDKTAAKYNNVDLLKAWALLLKVNGQTPKVFQFDVVNIGRQVLTNHFEVLKERFSACYEKQDLIGLRQNGKQMLDLIKDLDTLLQANDNFLLGKWIHDARKFGTTREERNYYEEDARKIITTWGTPSQPLNDYANRSWAGLTGSYYMERWKMFIEAAIRSVENNEKFDNQKFLKQLQIYEGEWPHQKDCYVERSTTDALVVSKRVYQKYSAVIASVHGPDN